MVEKMDIAFASFDKTLATKFMECISTEKCPVKKIAFENCRFKFDALRIVMQAIKLNKSIKSLKIKSVVLHEKDAMTIADMLRAKQTLSELTLSFCGLDDAGIIQIASSLAVCQQLKYLDLRSNCFEVQGLHSVMDALLQVSSCKTLMLEDIEVDEEQAIHSLKKLLDDR